MMNYVLLENRHCSIENCNSRVIKGGAWYYLPKVARSASRARNDDRVFSYVVGVRIAREIK